LSIRAFIQRSCRRLGYYVCSWPTDIDLEGHLVRLIRQLGINCVLDVGANTGQFAGLLRRLGYAGRIISFEPDPKSFEALKVAAESDSNWLVRQHALGRIREDRELNVPSDTCFASFRKPNDFALTEFNQKIERMEHVSVVRLDEITGNCTQGISNPRIFLKTDTQGWDLEVLAGADLRNVLMLQSELSVKPIYDEMPTYLEALDYIQHLGFELTGIFPLTRSKMLRLIELDAVFVRTDATY
jgi:FkbM family methyltransferase